MNESIPGGTVGIALARKDLRRGRYFRRTGPKAVENDGEIDFYSKRISKSNALERKRNTAFVVT
jgi:hypothetical protein